MLEVRTKRKRWRGGAEKKNRRNHALHPLRPPRSGRRRAEQRMGPEIVPPRPGIERTARPVDCPSGPNRPLKNGV
jgi:hypothetical protein